MTQLHRTPTRTAFLGAAVALALAGCFSLARPTPVIEQYVLGGAQAVASPSVPDGSTGLALGVRRLDLAPYLATPSILVRRGAHQIITSESRRWGEDLGQGINRAVAGHLAGAPLVASVEVAPWPVSAKHDHMIQLHVLRFEGVAPEDPAATEGEAHVRVSWEIIRPSDGAVVVRGTTDRREPGWRVGDYVGLVVLLDRGLAALSEEIAVALAGVPRG